MAMRKSNKLTFGVGVNDADYVIGGKNPDGKWWRCPFYRAWHHILERAYSPEYHARQPTYKDVTVCEEWHSFMAFRAWMQTQDWEGKHLDKDILSPGNKVYSPEHCIFVSRQINNLLTDHAASRGDCPIGASWNKSAKKYQAHLRINGRVRHLGLFTDPREAHLAWRKAKVAYVRSIADEQTDPRLSAALHRHADLIENGKYDNEHTRTRRSGYEQPGMESCSL